MTAMQRQQAFKTFHIELNRLKSLAGLYQKNPDKNSRKLYFLANELIHHVQLLQHQGQRLSTLTHALQFTNTYLSNPKDKPAKIQLHKFSHQLKNSTGLSKLGTLLMIIGVTVSLLGCLMTTPAATVATGLCGLGFFTAGIACKRYSHMDNDLSKILQQLAKTSSVDFGNESLDSRSFPAPAG